MADAATAVAVPFEVASHYSTRPSFQIPTTTLAGSAPTPVTPQTVPAVGYLQGILLEVTLTGTGGTTPAFTADGPWNVIQNIALRNPAGTNLIPPTTGYNLYLMNKWAGKTKVGNSADPRNNIQYSATAPSAHFFIWLPIGIDISEAYGSIPALSASSTYQVDITFAAISSVMTGAPSATVAVNATAHYFDFPNGNINGMPQETVPAGTPTMSVWSYESPTVSPGTQLVQSTNVGNVIRNHILVLRNAAGARIDTNGWPSLMEVYLDNQPRFSLSKREHEYLMSTWYNLTAQTKDVTGGLDTGVYVIPYHALIAGFAGDPANTRAQLLPTLTATLLQFRMQDFGSAVSRLEILTESVSTEDSNLLFSK